MATTSSPTFGMLLRQHRLAAGLTQEALAERAGLSARGLQDLERGLRLAPRAETVRLLADALGLDTESRSALIRAAHPELATLSPQTNQLPVAPLPVPLTSLVDRETEVAAIWALLRPDDGSAAARLVTLTGPGGVGKTRLALAVGQQMAAHFADGVVWVDLAPLRDPGVVASTIAHELGVREDGERSPHEGLARALAGRHLLLVLDNCEHLLPAMPFVGSLLTAVPGLAVLATSRTRLRLRGERELAVEPLAVPELTGATVPAAGELAGIPAVRLFVERAAEVRPGFAMSADNAAAVAAICQRLEGLPLALELAAARVKVLPAPVIHTRLAQRLPLLSGGPRDAPERQQTMRQAIAWSHDLLSEAEQVLLRRLAVFAGGCTVDAVEWVTGPGTRQAGGGDRVTGRTNPLSPCHPVTLSPSSDTLDQVAALVDQSLVRVEERPVQGGVDARFTMLETIREYALERLEESGETEAIRQAHAAFYLAMAERADPELTGPDQIAWLSRLETEHDNLRAALDWSLSGSDATTGLRLAAALGRFWRMRGHQREAASWLARALAQSAEEETPARGKALEEAGRLAHDRGDPEKTEALHAAALAIWRTLGDRRGEARALDELGNVAHDRGDFARATALHEEALAIAREVGNRRDVGRALNNLAMVALYQSDDERAWHLYNEALAALREVGDSYGVNVVLSNLGIVAIRRGDLDQATAISNECLAGCRELGDQQGVGSALVNLGEVALLQEDLAHAAALFAEGHTLLHDIGDDRAAADACLGLASVALASGDMARAGSLFGESLTLAHRVDDKMKIADALEGLAAVAVRQDQAERAARVLGAAAALRHRIDAPPPAHRRAALERAVAASRTGLGEDAFAATWEAGQAWPFEQAVAEAQDLAGVLARTS